MRTTGRLGRCAVLFDGLDDYEAGRCEDCLAHRGAPECRGCQFEPRCVKCHKPATTTVRARNGSRDAVCSAHCCTEALCAQADPEYRTRLEAERVTLQFAAPMNRKPSDLSESPLFGGPKQGGLFS